MESTNSGAVRGSNPLILQEAATAWRTDLGLKIHIPQKLSKSHLGSSMVLVKLMLQSVGRVQDVPDMRAPVGQRYAFARPTV